MLLEVWLVGGRCNMGNTTLQQLGGIPEERTAVAAGFCVLLLLWRTVALSLLLL